MATIEYKAFQRRYAVLQGGLDPESFAPKAFARDLLTREERSHATNKMHTPESRVVAILDALERRILSDPSTFYTMLAVLRDEPALERLADNLEGTYKELKQGAQATGGMEQTDSGGPHTSARGMKKPKRDDLFTHAKTTKWYELGLKLGVDEDNLDFIDKDKRNDTTGAMQEMYKAWLAADDENATWWKLIEKLRELKENALARKLEEKFC